ncbi:hypothetical protein JX265_003335 [Neoarthrinium moseri]|uniref:Uncharacterized protein n=1 Tax=Neoarthrinium moseri TaxID=1658444 RepID=A0A9Q0ARP6_9PEZI|nr:uncharacterized protein JN550_000830 [Neoarthrinium moseri]KAI1876758.1 hypothetical protein JN550_000830 [Neoarthrinium moseri]KAI1877327.1 hypothetical protein JX265_003335 [Neoarthrinium moseri]
MDHNEDENPLMGTDSESGEPPSSVFIPFSTFKPSQAPQSRSKWPSLFQIACFVVITLSWTTFLVWYSHYKDTSPFALIERGHCGWSIEEAKANGCVYDIMMSSWIPKPCYDEELSNSFLRANNFTYWRKNDGVEEVPEEEVRRGEFDILFTHGTYHSQHCM